MICLTVGYAYYNLYKTKISPNINYKSDNLWSLILGAIIMTLGYVQIQ